MAHTGGQLSGSGAQLSGSGAQLSGSGAQLSAISAYLHTSYLGAQLSASPKLVSYANLCPVAGVCALNNVCKDLTPKLRACDSLINRMTIRPD